MEGHTQASISRVTGHARAGCRGLSLPYFHSPQKREANACALAASGTGAWAPWPGGTAQLLWVQTLSLATAAPAQAAAAGIAAKRTASGGPTGPVCSPPSLQEGIPGAWLRGRSRGFPSGSPATHFPVGTPSCSAPAPAERQGAAGGARRAPLFPHAVLRFNHGESCPPAMLSKPRKKKGQRAAASAEAGLRSRPQTRFLAFSRYVRSQTVSASNRFSNKCSFNLTLLSTVITK